MFTFENVNEREPLKQGEFLEDIKGKLCGTRNVSVSFCLSVSFLTVYNLSLR